MALASIRAFSASIASHLGRIEAYDLVMRLLKDLLGMPRINRLRQALSEGNPDKLCASLRAAVNAPEALVAAEGLACYPSEQAVTDLEQAVIRWCRHPQLKKPTSHEDIPMDLFDVPLGARVVPFPTHKTLEETLQSALSKCFLIKTINHPSPDGIEVLRTALDKNDGISWFEKAAALVRCGAVKEGLQALLKEMKATPDRCLWYLQKLDEEGFTAEDLIPQVTRVTESFAQTPRDAAVPSAVAILNHHGIALRWEEDLGQRCKECDGKGLVNVVPGQEYSGRSSLAYENTRTCDTCAGVGGSIPKRRAVYENKVTGELSFGAWYPDSDLAYKEKEYRRKRWVEASNRVSSGSEPRLRTPDYTLERMAKSLDYGSDGDRT